MIDKSIIPEKLQSFDYYKHKLPLYLQQSYGFLSHFRIWFDLLVGDNHKGLVGSSDELLNLMNIFDEDYEDVLIALDSEHVSEEHRLGTTCDILDKLGALFGVSRTFEVTVNGTTSLLSLDNYEFLILIKTQIIKNYCEGTSEQMNAYYESVGLKMYVQTSTNEIATANLYLVIKEGETSYNYSTNIKKMFLAGLFTIQSAGIKYNHSFLDLDTVLFWDVINTEHTNGWGDTESGGQWVI